MAGRQKAKHWQGKFKGSGEPPLKRHHPHAYDELEPYVAEPELIRAVNLAIFLGRPLLLEGDAGCGKTRLARAVAFELGLPLFIWAVRSTGKAQDGLFTYDSLKRLHDVEMIKGGASPGRDPADPGNYYEMGELGKAFKLVESPGVVLIDEIDKADLDFPNDLLGVLDDPWDFKMPESGETVAATYKPIVIITSNKEKGNLPSPFLRRCIYYYVKFPEEGDLRKIVEKHYRNEGIEPPPMTEKAISRFTRLRDGGSLSRKPGTSEFLDWFKALHQFEPGHDPVALIEDESQLPYQELLLKLRADWLRAR